jgi:hypothetical protein
LEEKPQISVKEKIRKEQEKEETKRKRRKMERGIRRRLEEYKRSESHSQ